MAYNINGGGDLVTGDEIAYFNAAKSGERLYGKIVSDSYGDKRGQHTFTIQNEDGEVVLIKGRNLYNKRVWRKPWSNEEDRNKALELKHSKGRSAKLRKESIWESEDRLVY